VTGHPETGDAQQLRLPCANSLKRDRAVDLRKSTYNWSIQAEE
jgi:hypothetical protein